MTANRKRPPSSCLQKTTSAAACLTGVLAAFSAHAQAVSASAAGQPAAAPTNELQEVVVTADKRTESLQNAPISMSVLSGSHLDESTFAGVQDALMAVPGVTTSTNTQGGGSVVSIRGVAAGSPLFGGSSPVAYYLDSIPFGFVQNSIAPDANVYDLDRVEVLEGPQGTLYGASSEAGVIRILTLDPDLNAFGLKWRASDSGTGGGGNNYDGDAEINAPIVDGKLAIRGVVGYQSLSGWIDTPVKDDANDEISRTGRLKVLGQPTDDLSIEGEVWVSRDDFGGLSDGSTDHYRYTLLNESYYNDYNAYGLKVGYDFHSFTFASHTSYLNYSSAGTIDPSFLLGGLNFPEPLVFDSHVFTEEIDFASEQAGPWRWTSGAFFRNATDDDFIAVVPLLTYDWTNTSRSYAVFGELTRSFLDDKLDFTLGLRYFHDDVGTQEDHDVAPILPPNYYRADNTFTAAPTPRVVVTWHPMSDLSTYASFSEGFRSGSPQIYYTVHGQPGFPPANPDKLYNYEIGAKGGNSTVTFNAAVYYMDWKDVQQQVAVIVNGLPVSAILNDKSASGAGVDLGVTVRPVQGLQLGTTLSWNNLKSDADILSSGVVLFSKGDRLNFSPEFTAGAFMNYAVDLGHGYTGTMSISGNDTASQCFRAIVAGAQDVDCGNAVVTSRAAFALQFPSHWQLTLYGDNLNNFTGSTVGDPYYGPGDSGRLRPRTIGLQVDYHL
jgi:iron complex outermembrane receptor protein